MRFLLSLILVLLSAPALAGSVTLAWDHPEPETVTGYRIYIGISPRTYTRFEDAGNSFTHIVSDLPPGITYYFTATAYSTDSESDYSNEVSKKIVTSDLNLDGLTNVIDLQLMSNLISTGVNDQRFDLNLDNVLNVLDLQKLVNIILNKETLQ